MSRATVKAHKILLGRRTGVRYLDPSALALVRLNQDGVVSEREAVLSQENITN